MTDASLFIIMTADTNAWKKNPEGYWKKAPKGIADLLVNWMTPFHEGREWLQCDEAQRSISMAMQTLMLTAKSMDYDSCP
jgi:nitroreductase